MSDTEKKPTKKAASKKSAPKKAAAPSRAVRVSSTAGGASVDFEHQRTTTKKIAPRNVYFTKVNLAPPAAKSKNTPRLVLPQASSPTGAALRTFNQVAETLGITTDSKVKLLNLGKTKYFDSLKAPAPTLNVDQEDRLGYFLVVVELAGELVGDAGAWLRSANRAPVFGGKPPLDLLLQGHMEGLFSTLNYLKAAYGGWA